MKASGLALGFIIAVSAPSALAEGEHVLEDEFGNPVVAATPKPQPKTRTAPKRVTPKPAPAPDVLPPAVEQALTPALPAIPPPQIVVVAPPPAPPPAPEEIALACQTQVTRGNRTLSQGAFHLRIMPSAVFEDQADFRFSLIAPDHDSLIRKSRCVDLTCVAQVSPGTYYLVSQPDRKHPLRITLERSTGAFTAEADGRFGRTSEQGFCQPVQKATPLF